MLPDQPTSQPIALLLLVVSAFLLPAPASAQSTTRISVDSWGAEGDEDSQAPSVSADGRYVAFQTRSDLAGVGFQYQLGQQIYLRDRKTGETTLVSVNSQGQPAFGGASESSISGDGRFVAFASSATNLPGQHGNVSQIYLHDRQAGTTTHLSVNSTGDPADWYCQEPALSADNSTVVFQSLASNLVANDSNGTWDIFALDLQTGAITRVSVDSMGGQADRSSERPSISADGRHVAFESGATNLVAGDTNDRGDVFVHDRQTGQTSRVSIRSTGAQNRSSSIFADLSADGRFVAFQTLDDVFVHDRQTGQTILESKNFAGDPGNSRSSRPSISATGRYLTFASYSTNLVTGDGNGTQDCFLRDRQTGEVVLVSVSTAGIQGNSLSDEPVIAAESGTVVFSSHSDNLVSGDTNNREDLFAYHHVRLPHLTRTGWSGGIVELRISDATPAGQVAVLYGSLGQFTRLASPCAGLTVSLAAPQLATLLTADGAGSATYSFFAPAQATGLAVQVVDLGGCKASETAVLFPRFFRLAKGGAPCSSGFGIVLYVSEVTPLSSVALLTGSAGLYVKPGGACAGLTINLSTPSVLALLTADSLGTAQYNFFPPPALCGLTAQAVELGACVVSNTVTL